MWANVDLYSYPNGILEKCSLLAVFYSCVNSQHFTGTLLVIMIAKNLYPSR